jgi:DNA-binding transcriptional MocR family regulator
VELAEGTDTLRMTQHLLKQGISIAPGQIFSATQKYQNCIRLSCAQPWTAEVEQALVTVGKILDQ